MQLVTSQSGSIRISPLLVAVAASVTIATLIGLGTLSGMVPNKRAPAPAEGPLPSADRNAVQTKVCALCGTIESIRTVEVVEDATPAVGTDSKSEDPGISVLSALSGALGGNDTRKSARKRQAYRVTLRMDDGSFRAVSLSSPPTFAVGDKVRVVEGRLVRG